MASPQDIVAALSKLEESLVERLTTRIDQRFGEFRLEVNARFDEYQMIVAALRRIEESLAEDRGERTRLLTEVAELKKRVALLDARIRELEARLSED